MNKNLSKAIFYGSALLIGCSIGACSSWYKSTIPQQIEEIEIQLDGLEQKDLDGVEEKPAEITENSVEKPAKTEEKSWGNPGISASAIPQTSTERVPVAKTATTTPTVSKTETVIETYYDYEITILGTCPSQRDKSNRWEQGNRLNAIGIITSGEGKTSPMMSLNALVENWWNDYKLGKWSGRHLMSSLNNMSEFDNTWINSRVGFFIDFEGLFVIWDNTWEESKTANLTTEMMTELDHLASEGTKYLRWLDSTYATKCPNN